MTGNPMTVFDPSVYVPTGTFMAAPSSWDLSLARAAVLGIPFDCGTHAVRIGARLGPTAIREQSSLVRRDYSPPNDYEPLQRFGGFVCLHVQVYSSEGRR